MAIPSLKMLPISQYAGVNDDDPIRYYNFPIIGSLYRRRVELCLSELTGGDKILEVGFGSGVTFINLHEQYKEIYGLDLTAEADDVSKVFDELNIKTHLTNGSVLSMPYPENYFDSVLLISILEHLRPEHLEKAFIEILRVLKEGGQVVYGVPAERSLMTFFFRLLGYDIRQHHFSSEKEVRVSGEKYFRKVRINKINLGPLGSIYEVGHFKKEGL